MSDSTQNATTGTIQELRQAKTMVEEVMQSLDSQKQLLKQRGMNLPPMVSHTLREIRKSVSNLESVLVEEQTELGQLRALADMSAGINSSLNVDTVLEETMDVVIALTRAERGHIVLLEENRDFDYRVSRDNITGESITGKPEVSTTILREVISKNEPLLADNAYKDARFDGNSIARFTLRSVLCVPLTYKDNVMGAVYVDNRLVAGVFTKRELHTLTAFANTSAVAISNARLFAEIQQSLAEITRFKDLIDNVFASIGSGVVATDAKDDITLFNRAAEEILEIRADETLAKPLSTVLPRITADLDEHLAHIRERSESELLEAEVTTQEGARRAVTLRFSPLRDMQEAVRGVAMVIDDVTNKREQEQQLRIFKTYLPEVMVDQITEISGLALGGVRRTVTCLFAEVRPLYTLEGTRPAEIMTMINRFLSIATDCVHDTKGVVDKYMGTEVMAMWNTQLNPQEDDHAINAVESAMRMRDAFIQLYAELGIDPDPHFYRIGIHTGVATLGNVGSINRRDFTAIGDTINLAKRLEENTVAGQIIISQETLAYINENTTGDVPYTFQELEPIKVKGREQRTRIYEVFRKNA